MLKDKVVVITGASSGIGAEIALELAKHGAIPILLARSYDKLEKIATEIKGEHEIYQLDVTSTEQVQEVIEKIITKYNRIDLLINNAGFGKFAYFVDAPIEDYEEMMDVNYFGMVRCTKAVLPYMLKQKNGHIINVASVAGKIASAKAAGYSATKFAMIGFANSLRYELIDTGVYVSTLNPGPIDTPFFNIADPQGDYVKNVKWLMLTPKQVVDELIYLIRTKKPDRTIPYLSRVGVKFYHLFPWAFDKLVAKHINKK